MNRFNERRRALVCATGGIKPFWIFKEGQGLQNGVTIVPETDYFYTPTVSLSYIYARDKGVGDNGANITFSAIDLSKYTSIHIDYMKESSNETTRFYCSGSSSSTGLKTVLFYEQVENGGTRKEVSFNFVTGYTALYIWLQTNRGAKNSRGGNLYIYNLWLE